MNRFFLSFVLIGCLCLFFKIDTDVQISKAQYTPVPERTEQYNKWLSASVKISVNNTYGSGTIVYYDNKKNLAYIATCGHLWSGTMSAKEGLNKKLTCQITSWWQNKKLQTPKNYTAKVVFYNNVAGFDTALLTFTPDWIPNFFPIAPVYYQYKSGEYIHSLGCDRGSEVAHYKIKVVGVQRNNLTTIENSPRPGRSGGGLMTDEYYIGTCWGTSSTDGTGYGYFTTLKAIYSVWKENGYGFLLGMSFAQKFPIIDRNNPQGIYAKEYIFIPSLN